MSQVARRISFDSRARSALIAPGIGLFMVLMSLSRPDPAAVRSPAGRPEVPVPIYQWIGPHGVTHFSQTPPPGAARTINVRHFTIQLVRISRKKARAEYLSSLAQARAMERGLKRFERSEHLTAAKVPSKQGGSPLYQPGVGSSGYGRRGGGFYPDFGLGFYPPGFAPLQTPVATGPPPDLAPASGGFGICGYEIACPPMNAIPPPLTPPPPPVPVPHFPHHP